MPLVAVIDTCGHGVTGDLWLVPWHLWQYFASIIVLAVVKGDFCAKYIAFTVIKKYIWSRNNILALCQTMLCVCCQKMFSNNILEEWERANKVLVSCTHSLTLRASITTHSLTHPPCAPTPPLTHSPCDHSNAGGLCVPQNLFSDCVCTDFLP